MTQLLEPPDRRTRPARSWLDDGVSVDEPRIRTEWRNGVLVVTPQGVLGDLAAERERLTGLDPEAPLVVDLNECLIDDPLHLEYLHPRWWDRSPDHLSVVCRRLTARRLLRRAGLIDVLAVFGRVEDAVQAVVLERSGYGNGWATD